MWKKLELKLRSLEINKTYTGLSDIFLGQGNKNADIMFIVEDIKEEGLKVGNILASKEGEVLSKILKFVGINIDDVYITSLYKLDKNLANIDKVSKRELVDILVSEIMLVNPTYIVTLGNEVFNVLLSDQLNLSIFNNNSNSYKYVGKLFEYTSGMILVPIYDIAYISRAKKEEKTKIVEVLGRVIK